MKTATTLGQVLTMVWDNGTTQQVTVTKKHFNCFEVKPLTSALPFKKVSDNGKAFGFKCNVAW